MLLTNRSCLFFIVEIVVTVLTQHACTQSGSIPKYIAQVLGDTTWDWLKSCKEFQDKLQSSKETQCGCCHSCSAVSMLAAKPGELTSFHLLDSPHTPWRWALLADLVCPEESRWWVRPGSWTCFVFWDREILYLWLSWNSLYKPGLPWSFWGPPASASYL